MVLIPMLNQRSKKKFRCYNSEQGDYPIHIAAMNGIDSIIQILLENNASINVLNLEILFITIIKTVFISHIIRSFQIFRRF